MHLNPYGEYAVLLAINLCRDRPTSGAELQIRCEQAGLTVDRAGTENDVRNIAEFLDRWLKVVDAQTDQARADALNILLDATSAHPRLTDHAGDGWHLHYRRMGLTVSEQASALISVGTALHLVGRGMHRLGRCALPECRRPFADVTRNGRQRYCSHPCANRDAVRRHRAKAPAAWRWTDPPAAGAPAVNGTNNRVRV
ncbi:MAG: CGNR zinc finger domain-containing protein [Nakamurella sp.]